MRHPKQSPFLAYWASVNHELEAIGADPAWSEEAAPHFSDGTSPRDAAEHIAEDQAEQRGARRVDMAREHGLTGRELGVTR